MAEDYTMKQNPWVYHPIRTYFHGTKRDPRQPGDLDAHAPYLSPISILKSNGPIRVIAYDPGSGGTNGNQIAVAWDHGDDKIRAHFLHNANVYPEYLRPLIENGNTVLVEPGKPLFCIGRTGRMSGVPGIEHVHAIFFVNGKRFRPSPNGNMKAFPQTDVPDWLRESVGIHQKELGIGW
ncbi:MAG: hypothetical protein KDK33_15505 [Leptospiraceae bacterium]|nr:hypothetical protein [Leptospiraceae bacterium]